MGRIILTRIFIVFFLFQHYTSKVHAQNIDIEILRSINVNRNTGLDPVWSALSYSVTPLIVAVPAGMGTYALIKKDSITLQKTKLVAGTVIIAGIITTSIKYAVQRPRPYVTYPDILENTESGSPSFPSGHTSAAFSLSTSLTMAYPHWYVAVPAYAWAGSVGYSRMALGAHYPSDVLAGAIIGSGSAWLSLKLNQWLNHKSR